MTHAAAGASIEAMDRRMDPTPLEQDGRFPSGPWTGFYLQRSSSHRHWMDLGLSFRAGSLRGDGLDEVGLFVVDGHYDVRDGNCWWTKRYIGQHDVWYTGYNEGRGIWGVWEIPPDDHGGFHIWPAGMGDPTQQERTEKIEAAEAPHEEVHPRAGTPA